jgi:hypothetical protein
MPSPVAASENQLDTCEFLMLQSGKRQNMEEEA